MKKEERNRFVFDEDALESTTEISVYPENEDNYLQPDVGDKITIPDVDDEPFIIQHVTQVQDSHSYEFVIGRPLPEECPEGTQLYITRT